ncbi:MAG: Fic family protein [Alphaproteobacteria bacterium]|nr:MAG: Fic family protein [Alphaproteobacteria bacterium]
MGTDGRMEPLNTATVRITPEILSLIAEIDEFKGAWRAIGRIAPERLSGLRRVATIESVGSSTRIEGARLTDREVEKLLATIRLGSFTTRDEQEVAGYAEVMETIFSAYEAISFTENHIRQLHRDLLAHSTKDERHRGAYKTLSNNVEAFNEQGESLGIVFETASPFDTPRRMEELIAWLEEQGREKLHPLLVVAIFVVVFLEIHPFQDGNGRLSRILTTLLLLRAGYAYVPYSSLESIIEQSKESYYISLRRTQGTIRIAEPDWNPWIEFFLRALHRQKTRLEKKMERERIILAELPELSVTLLELAREHGRITVAEAARITDASRHTIKDHFKALVDQGHLVLHGAGRGAWYGLS